MASDKRKPAIISPGAGRTYDMGRMQAVFKADGEEAAGAYSVSEWWLEPNTAGPPTHDHPEDHVFYVLDGTVSLCIEDSWLEAPKGSYVLIPGSTSHTFENRARERAGFISFNAPGGFEAQLPRIVEHFAANPLGDALNY